MSLGSFVKVRTHASIGKNEHLDQDSDLENVVREADVLVAGRVSERWMLNTLPPRLTRRQHRSLSLSLPSADVLTMRVSLGTSLTGFYHQNVPVDKKIQFVDKSAAEQKLRTKDQDDKVDCSCQFNIH